MNESTSKTWTARGMWLSCVASAAIAAWAVFAPIPLPPQSVGMRTILQDLKQGSPEEFPDAEELRDVWSQPLQGSVERRLPPTDIPVVSTPISEPGEFRLIGTMVEPMHSMAMVADASGQIDIQAEGEELRLQPAGVRLIRVRATSVVIQIGEAEILLHLQESINQADYNASERQSSLERSDEPADQLDFSIPLDQELELLNGDAPPVGELPSEPISEADSTSQYLGTPRQLSQCRMV